VIVGILEVRLRVPGARSLKEKRRVLNALKDRLRGKFNVSVAEVDGQELPQSATVAVVQVSNDSRYINSSLDSLVEAVRGFRGAELVDYHMDMF